MCLKVEVQFHVCELRTAVVHKVVSLLRLDWWHTRSTNVPFECIFHLVIFSVSFFKDVHFQLLESFFSCEIDCSLDCYSALVIVLCSSDKLSNRVCSFASFSCSGFLNPSAGHFFISGLLPGVLKEQLARSYFLQFSPFL